MSKDYYDILGVARDADDKTLKSAYRKKVMRYHPDRNPDDAEAEAKFKSVSEAYEILSDPQKRAAYDQFGDAAFARGGAGRGHGARSAEDIFSDVFGDVFSEFFGTGSRRRERSARGADLRRDVEISLEEAFSGTQLEFTFTGNVKCTSCSGSGATPGSQPETCNGCGGGGRVRMQQGFFSMEHTCPHCQGRGQIIASPCKSCQGSGAVARERQVKADIPSGIDHGQRIRLDGQGEPGPQGGAHGDLYVFVNIAEHEFFIRKSRHLNARASIPMTLAALGGNITLPTIDGQHTQIAIPAGTQTGEQLTLAECGMPSLRGRGRGRGDLVVEIFVETPRNLSAKQQDALREFAETCGSKSHPESESFLGRVKTFFDRNNVSS